MILVLNDNVYYCIIDYTIGLLDQSVALVENKREIENLQEQVSAMRVQVLIKKEENKEYEDAIRGIQSHVIVIYNVSISEFKEQLNETSSSKPVMVVEQDTLSDSEISSSDSESDFDFESDSDLESGIMTIIKLSHGKLNSKFMILCFTIVWVSCFNNSINLGVSKSEALQLFQFVMEQQKVSLPILQKIKDDSCSNDDKASLFLKSINDDPILLTALRQDKRQHEEGRSILCGWDSFDFIYSFV